ncbi:MAG: chemotaxis protein [Nocardia sp.]|uniref:chemotaxis protein CheB n=1 Tax=Nocardia sp. TaxID=1821 RepID=UPI00262DC373|nr:chemotaxis protein CheB [Nocardia sp.]MCU1646779.1 chemotaxis protein [Nocardia sp.]
MTPERHPSEQFDVVAVASSAGGVSALGVLLGALGPDLPVPIFVVQHLDPRHKTVLAQVLARRTELDVKLAETGERALAGTVYLAPPDRHLLVGDGGIVTLSSSELVHFLRPSADLLFESIAGAYGPRAIACVLTGTGSDGSMGVEAVKTRGGTVIAEDPATAEFTGMPKSAVSTGSVDFVLPLDEIAAVIRELVETERK